MGIIIKDRVKDTSTSTGTGDITTSGTPPTGFRGFDGVMETSDTSVIAIHHQTADEWEICKTVYSGSNVLTRGTLLASSTGSRIDFSAGTKDVWIDLAADQVVDLDRPQTLTNKTLTSPTMTAPTLGTPVSGNLSNCNAFTGDSGSGGSVGLVPAPASGDAAAGKVLGAGGAWVAAAGGARNRAINPLGQYMQAGVGSLTDGSYSGFDQWYGLTQTAAITSSQLTDVEDGMPFAMRFNQDQATAQRFGVAQVFESVFSKDMRSKTVALGARVRCSVSTTLRYAILAWTGTADSPTKDVVNSWTSTTFTAGNFFLASNLTVVAAGSKVLTANTFADISLSGTFGSSLNNAIIVFWTDSAQAQNVTLDISKVFFGLGASAPATFDPPAPDKDFAACLRYYYKYIVQIASARVAVGFAASTTVAEIYISMQVDMRSTPSVAISSNSDWTIYHGSSESVSGMILGSASTPHNVTLVFTTSGITTATMIALRSGNAGAYFTLDARL